ncbi:MAG: PilZ domain-containing protein [Nitrospiraceae bacterium]
MEQRKCPRFPVRFRSSFTSTNVVGGEGSIVDLSIRGCRVESQAAVPTGTTLELRIHVTDHDPPIGVDQAVVRWARGLEFGLEFVHLIPDDWAKLQHVVNDIEAHPYVKGQQETTTS